uniref:Uncharacterized protein n=1 Tax=Arundo donax TaxID=35708 RepID=A0A0A9H645_ARUDO
MAAVVHAQEAAQGLGHPTCYSKCRRAPRAGPGRRRRPRLDCAGSVGTALFVTVGPWNGKPGLGFSRRTRRVGLADILRLAAAAIAALLCTPLSSLLLPSSLVRCEGMTTSRSHGPPEALEMTGGPADRCVVGGRAQAAHWRRRPSPSGSCCAQSTPWRALVSWAAAGRRRCILERWR